MDTQNYHQYLEQVITIAKSAGAAIMQVYATDFTVKNKDDNSPLTDADLAAHHVITNALKQLAPHLPILSEESEGIDEKIRKTWSQYWLIDPLDGTREFVKRNGEFTVNIALIDQHIPVLGVVYAPVDDLLYYAVTAHGAYKQAGANPALKIHTKTSDPKRPIIAGSRSHSDEKMQRFLHNIKNHTGQVPELISMGSSLKICLVAEGQADVYPRLGPTSEWDTAAAHCILQEAGGDIVEVSGSALRYNTKRSLLNPMFFASGKGSQQWEIYL
ncbi:MAG: 3'(2'),5'-bisphosphate nucleotidase CysQ [Methylotenera sp.]|nr:3'(2'),5'-bisphosphate nucleotidase CysQ [Methylotenera sp.]MDD4926947.1 3'(2'),5'-bisphosphate nucleotidase CysQ [Methylotenera sp.]